MDKLLSFLGSKNLKNPIIIIVAVVVVLLLRNCDNLSFVNDAITGTSQLAGQDTIFQEVIKTETDTVFKEADLPEPIIEYVEVQVIIKDTVFIVTEEDNITEEEILKMGYRKDSLFVYDSTYVATDSTYILLYHIEALGRVRAFAHRLDNLKAAPAPKLVPQNFNILPDEGAENRKWLLMFDAIARTDFTKFEQAEYYLGGSLYRTKETITYGVNYKNQIGGKNHIFGASFGVRF